MSKICIFHLNSVNDKNAGKHVTHFFFFILTLGTWAAPTLKFRPGSAPAHIHHENFSLKKSEFLRLKGRHLLQARAYKSARDGKIIPSWHAGRRESRGRSESDFQPKCNFELPPLHIWRLPKNISGFTEARNQAYYTTIKPTTVTSRSFLVVRYNSFDQIDVYIFLCTSIEWFFVANPLPLYDPLSIYVAIYMYILMRCIFKKFWGFWKWKELHKCIFFRILCGTHFMIDHLSKNGIKYKFENR